jgi:hypothetical protein
VSGRYLRVDRTDVAHDKEALFNELYDCQLIPALRKVPGVLLVARYRNSSPTDPRYLTLFDVESPAVVDGPQWTSAADRGGWRGDLLPLTMNRHHALYSWVGGKPELTYSTRYLFCVMLDVEPHMEALLNELYDVEHIPLLLDVPGVVNAVRYKTQGPGHPAYLAIYEIERPDIPASEAWIAAADTGRWKPEVRPYTYNKRFVVYEVLDQAP